MTFDEKLSELFQLLNENGFVTNESACCYACGIASLQAGDKFVFISNRFRKHLHSNTAPLNWGLRTFDEEKWKETGKLIIKLVKKAKLHTNSDGKIDLIMVYATKAAAAENA